MSCRSITLIFIVTSDCLQFFYDSVISYLFLSFCIVSIILYIVPISISVMPKRVYNKNRKAQATNAAALAFHAGRHNADPGAPSTPAPSGSHRGSAGNTPHHGGDTYSPTSAATGVNPSGMPPLNLNETSPAARTRARTNRESFQARTDGRGAGQQAGAAANQLIAAVNRRSPAGAQAAAANLTAAAQAAAQAAAALGNQLPTGGPIGISPTELAQQQVQTADLERQALRGPPQAQEAQTTPQERQRAQQEPNPAVITERPQGTENLSFAPGVPRVLDGTRSGLPKFKFRPTNPLPPRAPLQQIQSPGRPRPTSSPTAEVEKSAQRVFDPNPSGPPRGSPGISPQITSGNGGRPPSRPNVQHLSSHEEADRLAEQQNQQRLAQSAIGVQQRYQFGKHRYAADGGFVMGEGANLNVPVPADQNADDENQMEQEEKYPSQPIRRTAIIDLANSPVSSDLEWNRVTRYVNNHFHANTHLPPLTQMEFDTIQRRPSPFWTTTAEVGQIFADYTAEDWARYSFDLHRAIQPIADHPVHHRELLANERAAYPHMITTQISYAQFLHSIPITPVFAHDDYDLYSWMEWFYSGRKSKLLGDATFLRESGAVTLQARWNALTPTSGEACYWAQNLGWDIPTHTNDGYPLPGSYRSELVERICARLVKWQTILEEGLRCCRSNDLLTIAVYRDAYVKIERMLRHQKSIAQNIEIDSQRAIEETFRDVTNQIEGLNHPWESDDAQDAFAIDEVNKAVLSLPPTLRRLVVSRIGQTEYEMTSPRLHVLQLRLTNDDILQLMHLGPNDYKIWTAWCAQKDIKDFCRVGQKEEADTWSEEDEVRIYEKLGKFVSFVSNIPYQIAQVTPNGSPDQRDGAAMNSSTLLPANYSTPLQSPQQADNNPSGGGRATTAQPAHAGSSGNNLTSQGANWAQSASNLFASGNQQSGHQSIRNPPNGNQPNGNQSNGNQPNGNPPNGNRNSHNLNGTPNYTQPSGGSGPPDGSPGPAMSSSGNSRPDGTQRPEWNRYSFVDYSGGPISKIPSGAHPQPWRAGTDQSLKAYLDAVILWYQLNEYPCRVGNLLLRNFFPANPSLVRQLKLMNEAALAGTPLPGGGVVMGEDTFNAMIAEIKRAEAPQTGDRHRARQEFSKIHIKPGEDLEDFLNRFELAGSNAYADSFDHDSVNEHIETLLTSAMDEDVMLNFRTRLQDDTRMATRLGYPIPVKYSWGQLKDLLRSVFDVRRASDAILGAQEYVIKQEAEKKFKPGSHMHELMHTNTSKSSSVTAASATRPNDSAAAEASHRKRMAQRNGADIQPDLKRKILAANPYSTPTHHRGRQEEPAAAQTHNTPRHQPQSRSQPQSESRSYSGHQAQSDQQQSRPPPIRQPPSSFHSQSSNRPTPNKRPGPGASQDSSHPPKRGRFGNQGTSRPPQFTGHSHGNSAVSALDNQQNSSSRWDADARLRKDSDGNITACEECGGNHDWQYCTRNPECRYYSEEAAKYLGSWKPGTPPASENRKHPQTHGIGEYVSNPSNKQRKRELAVISLSGKPGLMISGRLENVNFHDRMLADTGATISVISEHTLHLLPLRTRSAVTPSDVQFTDATGATHKARGQVQLSLTVFENESTNSPHATTKHVFVVSSTLIHPVVLGMDVLPQLYDKLEFGTGKLTVKRSTIISLPPMKGEIPLELVEGIVLGPRSSRDAYVTVPLEHQIKPPFGECLAESTPVFNRMGQQLPVHHASFIGNLNNNVTYKIEFHNYGDSPMSLSPGTRIGRVIPYGGRVVEYEGESRRQAAVCLVENFPNADITRKLLTCNP